MYIYLLLCTLLPFIMLSACTTYSMSKVEVPGTTSVNIPLKTETPFPRVRAPEGELILYPAEPDKLIVMLDHFLITAQPLGKKPIALVVPHASYVASGLVAAYGFRQLEEYDYEVAIIIANDHFPPMGMPIAVWPTGVWRTPLGDVAVDTELAQALVNADKRITANEDAFAGEHPIEAEIPFLQRTCPQCKIVPVIMGNQYQADIDALANALIELLPHRNAIIIASSDLSHFPTSEKAKEMDAITLQAIVSLDPKTFRLTIVEQMMEEIPNVTTCACGQGAIFVTMQVARGLGANSASILSYTNSGELPEARKDYVTGFGSVMFYKNE